MKRLRQNLLIAITSVFLLLGGLEGFARVFLGVRPRAERIQMSHQLGWEWTPGYDAVETYCGTSYRMTISRQGLRDREVAVPKPPGTYRIIALGDSITAGFGAELDDAFVKLLERSLQGESAGRTIEVVNAGTDDYGTQQERIWLQERGLTFEPDLLILNVFLNDARGFSSPPAVVAALNNFFVRRSAFYLLYRNWVREQMVAREKSSPSFRFRYVENRESRAWVTDPEALTRVIREADRDWGMAWNDEELARIEGELEQIIRLADGHGFKLLLVIFPVDVQVYAQVDTPLGLDRPQQKLVAFAQSQHVPVLDLLPVLRGHRDEDLFCDQAHLTPEGHRIVAEALLRAVREYELVPRFLCHNEPCS